MGLDLTIVIDVYPDAGFQTVLGYNRLSFHRSEPLFEWIVGLPWQLLPVPLRPYEDDGLKERTTDAYGNALHYVWADDFKALFGLPLYQRLTSWNQAIVQLLIHAPPGFRVILEWN